MESTEVVVAADAPGTFQMVVRNNSTIVDSYVIEVDDPPSWLTVAHSDTNLLPDETRTVQVTLAVLPMSLAVAQRIEVTLSVRSAVDTTQAAEVPMTVVVPPFGPPATLVAHPTRSALWTAARELSRFVSTTGPRTTLGGTASRRRTRRAS